MEKPEVDFRAGEIPKNIRESWLGLALTGRPPLPRMSKETNRSEREGSNVMSACVRTWQEGVC